MVHTHADSTKVSFDSWLHFDVTQPRWRRAVSRILDLRNIGWDIGVRAMERAAGHRRGDRMSVHLRFSPRDLLAEKGKAVRDDLESLADAVMRAGTYPAREEAQRALRAVTEAVRDRVPPELLIRLSDYLPEAEASRLRKDAAARLARDEGFPLVGPKE